MKVEHVKDLDGPGTFVRVSFPKEDYSRGFAWELVTRRFKTVPLLGLPGGTPFNPWRKDHYTGNEWAWHAPVGTVERR